jgi:hypothetical protein
MMLIPLRTSPSAGANDRFHGIISGRREEAWMTDTMRAIVLDAPGSDETNRSERVTVLRH